MWTLEKLHETLKTHSNPSTLDGFFRKSYCGKGNADLQVADGAREFVSKITTDVRDRDNEIVDPKGIDFKSYLANPVILWSHNYSDPAIGRSLWIKRWTENRRTRGHIAKGIVAEGIQKAEDIFKLMQQGILGTVSIGFVPLKGHQPTDDEIKANGDLDGVRFIHDKTSMLEYSVVNVPANPDATIDAISKGLIEVPVSLQQDLGLFVPPNAIQKKSIPYLQTPLDGVEAGWNRKAEVTVATFDELKIMCAWLDEDNIEFKRSYKYIHHRAGPANPLVWLGLAESMSKLNTFTELIPESDRLGVWKHLAKHYSDFGKEPPELVSKATSFALAGVDLSTVRTDELIRSREPIEVQAVKSQEIPMVTNATDSPEIIGEKIKETYEVKVLGKV